MINGFILPCIDLQPLPNIVWVMNNGAIPDGFKVAYIDPTNSLDCTLENLKLVKND